MVMKISDPMKELIVLLIEQSPPDDVYTMYKDFGMQDICDYIEENYLNNNENKTEQTGEHRVLP